MKFIHISDLHFNPKEDGRTTRSIRESLIPYLKDNNIKADELIITGDFRYAKNQGDDQSDIDSVIAYIKSIAEAVSIEDVNHIHLVPGNHDLDRNLIPADTLTRIRNEYDPGKGRFNNTDLELLKQQFVYFYKVCATLFGSNHYWKKAELHTYRFINETVFVYLNTAILHNSKEDRGRLFIGNDYLDILLCEIDSQYPNYPVIVLAHHSPDLFEKHEKEAVEDIFRNHPNVFLYLCGDSHEAWPREVNGHLEVTMGCLKQGKNATAAFLYGDTNTQKYSAHHWAEAWEPFVAVDKRLQTFCFQPSAPKSSPHFDSFNSIVNASNNVGDILAGCYMSLYSRFYGNPGNSFDTFYLEYSNTAEIESQPGSSLFSQAYSELRDLGLNFSKSEFCAYPERKNSISLLFNRITASELIKMFFFIRVIDLILYKALDPESEDFDPVFLTNARGRLKTSREYDFIIYISPGNIAKSCFTGNIQNPSLENRFMHLCFFRKSGNHPNPSVISLPTDFASKHKLQIVIIPHFYKFDSYHSFVGSKNGYFWGEYMPISDDIYNALIITLDQVLEMEPDIIVFPEYTFSEEMLEAASAYIREKLPAKLCFVFAGTTQLCTTTEPSSKNSIYNNAAHIIDKVGQLRQVQYKKIPYTDKSLRAYLKTTHNIAVHKNMNLLEKLDNPGEKVSLIGLTAAGLVQFAICKDMIGYNDFIKYYTDTFKPFLLIVPAYSKSLETFKNNAIEVASDYGTVSIVVNNCAADRENKSGILDDVGFICHPHRSSDGAVEDSILPLCCDCTNCVGTKIPGSISKCGYCEQVLACYFNCSITFTKNSDDVNGNIDVAISAPKKIFVQ